MAAQTHVWTSALLNLGKKKIDLVNDKFRVIFLTPSNYAGLVTAIVASQGTANTLTDVKAVANYVEASANLGGAGYPSTGLGRTSGYALTGLSWTASGTTCTFTAGNVSAGSPTAAFNPSMAVIFWDGSNTDGTLPGGTDLLDFPIIWDDFGGPVAGNGSPYTYTLNAAGLFAPTAA